MNAKAGKMRNFLVWLVATALTVGLFGFSLTAYAADDGSDVKITIIHTNDIHSRVGVEPYVAALAQEKRDAGEHVLVLSAGDVLHGQPLATLSRGKSIVEIMNAVGYDAMVPGNHDFNYGTARLTALSKQMDFPVLAANVTNEITGKSVYTPSIIKEFDGVKVGIFGLATPETKTKTDPGNVRNIAFGNPVKSALQTVGTLQKEGCNVIVALTHLGVDEETALYERSTALVPSSGIHVIIDGHSHSVWEDGLMQGKTLLASTGEYGNNIGVVELTVNPRKGVQSKTASLVPVPTEENPNPDFVPDESIAKLIEGIQKSNDKITSQVVASTGVDLQGEREYARTQETNLGNLICDAMLAVTGADAALTNGGGIRASIPAGDITKGDILTVLPFGNYIVTKEMTGQAILDALELGISAYPETAGGFPQVGGMRFTFDASQPAGKRLIEVYIGKDLLDPAKTYTLATNDFMAAGGDGYTMIGDAKGEMIYKALDEAVIEYLHTEPSISTSTEGRIVVQGAEQAAA